MSVETNPQGTFTIEYEYRDDDSPLELYRVEYWTVRSVLLDWDIENFSSTQVQRAHYEQFDEITGVSFSDDGMSLVVRQRHGSPSLVPLPTAFRLSDDETDLILSYADGTERCQALLRKNLAALLWGKSEEMRAYWERSAREEVETLRERLKKA